MSQVWRVNIKLAFWKFATFISLNSYLCLIPSLSCRSNVSHIKLTSATCALILKDVKIDHRGGSSVSKVLEDLG